MDQLIDNFYSTQTNPLAYRIAGTGFTMEGSENNPVMFELMSELPWRREKITKETWLRDYVCARYGKDDPQVQEAWRILSESIYNCPAGNNQQGPHESIFCCRPSLNNFQASSWSKMKNYYDPSATLKAAELMNSVAERFRGNNNFEYDLVDITRQAVADHARVEYQLAIAYYKAFMLKDFKEHRDRFIQLLDMQDELLATRSEFRLGHWTEMAIACGTSEAERKLYEWNARVQITTWGNRYCADTGKLRDYAHKEWQGLLKDFYKVRWQTFFRLLEAELEAGSKPDLELLGTGKNSNKTADELMQMARPQEVSIDYYAIEEPWTLQQGGYSSKAEGDAVDVAGKAVRMVCSL
jgi:alpha-N-acetylglucosaminidase